MKTETNAADFRAALKQGIHLLRDAQIPSETLTAELLLLHATGKDRTWLYAHPDDTLDASIAEHYFELIRRRIAGVPTQYLTGKQEFWGLEFEVTPDVLIPRPETEHLIEVALDRLAVRELRADRSPRLTGEGVSIIDIGTGSGCIAIALAKELPGATIVAADISPAALALAQRNATRLGFAGRITFLESNLFSILDANVDSSSSLLATRHLFAPNPEAPILLDLVISNPPYISRCEADTLPREVRDHEPHTALLGGEEGYELYGHLIPGAAGHLKAGGLLVVELGHDSLPAVRPLLDTHEWTNVLVTKDLAGIPRVLSAERR